MNEFSKFKEDTKYHYNDQYVYREFKFKITKPFENDEKYIREFFELVKKFQ